MPGNQQTVSMHLVLSARCVCAHLQAVCIYMAANISGGHINPVSMWGRMPSCANGPKQQGY